MGNRVTDITSQESSVSEDNFFLLKWLKNHRRKDEWPYVSRRELVQRVQRQIARRRSYEELMESLVELRKVFGLMSPNDVDVDDSFVLNEKKRWKVQKLLMLIEKKLNDWPKAAELSCHMLIKQISPRLVQGRMPIKHVTDLNDVNLTQVVLHKKRRLLNRLKVILRENPQLKSLELGYTGLDNTELMNLLPTIGKLEELHYLGLSGNRLDKNIITVLMQFLQNPANLPAMQWSDLQNNDNIFSLPMPMLTLLKQRWPANQQSKTNFRQLADCDAILVVEDVLT